MNKAWIYGGVFLNEKSKTALIDRFAYSIPKDWTIFCDHMTSIFNRNIEGNEYIIKYLQENKLKKVKLEIISIGISEFVIALGVKTEVPSTNNHKHITFAVAPGHKPFESNNIQDWTLFKTPLYVNGTIKI